VKSLQVPGGVVVVDTAVVRTGVAGVGGGGGTVEEEEEEDFFRPNFFAHRSRRRCLLSLKKPCVHQWELLAPSMLLPLLFKREDKGGSMGTGVALATVGREERVGMG